MKETSCGILRGGEEGRYDGAFTVACVYRTGDDCDEYSIGGVRMSRYIIGQNWYLEDRRQRRPFAFLSLMF
ncbi:hypothetical protein F5Y13DRAFT_173361 [Hypoxylon sp. FL1857]|nr:hypothetical protein F5Y13DRAFT_173361 [Hypoxylon sp. FL1857]